MANYLYTGNGQAQDPTTGELVAVSSTASYAPGQPVDPADVTQVLVSAQQIGMATQTQPVSSSAGSLFSSPTAKLAAIGAGLAFLIFGGKRR